MPKIIKDLRPQLLAEARHQILANGYKKTTIRSVAAGCGVAAGTVYNYFPSKDVLIASFLLEDWQKCIGDMQSAMKQSFCIYTQLESIYHPLQSFLQQNQRLFSDQDAEKAFHTALRTYHGQLRSQLAQLIVPMCEDAADPVFLSEFAAEALLTWTVAGKPFPDIIQILQKIFR